jgi:DNA-binding protein HU-beta
VDFIKQKITKIKINGNIHVKHISIDYKKCLCAYFNRDINVMNKKELINVVSKITHVAKKDVDVTVTAILETIILTLAREEPIRLVGFGSFHIYTRKVKTFTSHNDIKTVKFLAGKFFRKSVYERFQ